MKKFVEMNLNQQLEIGKEYSACIETLKPTNARFTNDEDAIQERDMGSRFPDGDIAKYMGKDSIGNDIWVASCEDSGKEHNKEFTTQFYTVKVHGMVI